jgi:cytosine/adenosine deaminase-related metal-dependent hydrolase
MAPDVRVSRRELLAGGAAAFAIAAAGCGSEAAQQAPATPARRLLLKGGCVLSLDPTVGDFDTADVLIEGTRIADVRPSIAADAEIVDASGSIVMPGFIDTHRHMWQGALRSILPDGLLSDYTRDVTGTARAVMRPEDAHIGDLVSALGALNAGVTTVLDWSHIGNSPAHADACIDALRESGIRAVYGYNGSAAELRRLRTQQFASADQLLTLAYATGAAPAAWAAAREVGASISLHAGGSLDEVATVMGPDVTYIHGTTFTEAAWTRIRDSGGHLSIAAPIEMEMGHGIPPIQPALDHGIRPSLSVDVETQMPSDFFTQMRTVFTLQRMQALARQRAGDPAAPRLLNVREVIEFATIAGARANRLDAKIGTLTPGKEADVILLRMDAINVLPVNNAYGAVVLGMDTSNVDTVIVRGAVRKRGGRLVGLDLARVNRLAQESRDYILGKTGWKRTRVGPGLPAR